MDSSLPEVIGGPFAEGIEGPLSPVAKHSRWRLYHKGGAKPQSR